MTSPARRTIPLPSFWYVPPNPITPILLVSAAESDSRILGDALRDSQFLLIQAREWNSALKLTRHMVFPVILYDRDFDSSGWTPAVERLTRACPGSSILLLAPADDEDCAGRCVLSRPFLGVLQCLDAALAALKNRS